MKNGLALLLSAFIAAIPLSAAAGATQTVTLEVKNMSCAACPITVKKALMKVPGVESATVDFETKTAVVTFDPDKANIEALTEATGDAGYPSALALAQQADERKPDRLDRRVGGDRGGVMSDGGMMGMMGGGMMGGRMMGRGMMDGGMMGGGRPNEQWRTPDAGR